MEAKGLTNFINTIGDTLDEHENCVLVLVGDGDKKEEIETILKVKHLHNKILLPGRFEGSELYAWYVCASGFVLPSTYEPFGAVVNEALIFGNKVFCSKYAGASSLIFSDCGILFDPLNEIETIHKLNIFLDSIDVIDEIDMKNKPSIILNSQKYFVNEWLKLIEKIDI